MPETTYMVTLDDNTTTHRTFARAAQHLATTIGDTCTVERGIQIVEFSEADGILLSQVWTPRMIDGEIAWSAPSLLGDT